MASATLHIKDSYYFEVPKFLWPADYDGVQGADEFPDFLVRLDQDFLDWQARRVHQQAGELEGLPSILVSDKFVYANPIADFAYQTQVQMKEDSKQALDDLLEAMNWGESDAEDEQAHQPGGELDDFVVDDDFPKNAVIE